MLFFLCVNGKYFSSVKILDSSYYSLLLNYGIIAFIIIMYMMLKAIKYYNVDETEENKKNRLLLFVWILYSLCETSCLNPLLGFPLLLLKDTLFGNGKVIKKEKKNKQFPKIEYM